GQGQNLKCRMLVDKTAYFAGEYHHDDQGDHDGNNHKDYLIHQPYGGKYTVKGKNHVQKNDLKDHPSHAICGIRLYLSSLPFHFVMNFNGGFEQEKQSTARQNQIPPAKINVKNGKNWLGKLNNIRDPQQQRHPKHQRKEQAQIAGLCLLPRGQLIGYDGDKNNVVHPQDDFQKS